MSTAQQRIHELKVRQVFNGSSMIVKLNKVDGEFFYSVSAWLAQDTQDVKTPILVGKYNNEDPEELMNAALLVIGCKKLKLGRPIDVHSSLLERTN